MFSQAKSALKCILIPIFFHKKQLELKPQRKHVLAAFKRGMGIFDKNGRHLGGHFGFLGPHHDSSQSPSIFLHPRHVSNHLCSNFLWTSHDHRHPLWDWSTCNLDTEFAMLSTMYCTAVNFSAILSFYKKLPFY